jgi:DNA-binding transcriptional LysR family regulator
VSRAAQKLGMSQPAVSKALRRLRTTFNDPLFIRAPRGVTPTPRAHAPVRAARPAIIHLKDALRTDESFDPQLDQRPSSFALSDVGEMVFLP